MTEQNEHVILIFTLVFFFWFARGCTGSCGSSSSLVSSGCWHCFLFGRDEIYCQICKQLVDNQSTRSRMQGWILLSICLGIFPPTNLFMKVSALHVNSCLSILTHSADDNTREKKYIFDRNTDSELFLFGKPVLVLMVHFKSVIYLHSSLFLCLTVFGSFCTKWT